MCDIRPGTRCAYDMRTKVQKRAEKLAALTSTGENHNPEVVLAQARLRLAEGHYDATREGIKKLEKELLEHDTLHEELMLQYKTAKMVNLTQSLSVKEVKTGRHDRIAESLAEVYGQHPDEVSSILDVARTQQEKRLIKDLNEDGTQQVSTSQWHAFIQNLDNLTQHKQADTMQELRDSSPPPIYIQQAYEHYDRLSVLSAGHKQNQLKHIADITGADIGTVKAAHQKLVDNYRASGVQIQAPEVWVRGESSTAGMANNPKMMYAPSDDASNYATYAILHGEDVLPDYQKRASNYVTVDQSGEHLEANFYSTTGKLLYTREYGRDSTSLSRLKQDSEGALHIGDRLHRNHMSLEEVAVNHLNLPYYSADLVRGALKTSPNANVVELYLKTLATARRTWNKKAARLSNASTLTAA